MWMNLQTLCTERWMNTLLCRLIGNITLNKGWLTYWLFLCSQDKGMGRPDARTAGHINRQIKWYAQSSTGKHYFSVTPNSTVKAQQLTKHFFTVSIRKHTMLTLQIRSRGKKIIMSVYVWIYVLFFLLGQCTQAHIRSEYTVIWTRTHTPEEIHINWPNTFAFCPF